MSSQTELQYKGIEVVNKLFNLVNSKFRLSCYMSKEDMEDMKQDGFVEMLEYIKKFDPKRGYKLDTFLSKRILGFFIDYLKRHYYRQILNSVQYIDDIKENICQIFNIDRKQVNLTLDKIKSNETDIKKLIFDTSIGPESELILDYILKLPDIKIYVIIAYYYLDKPIKEIAEELGFDPTTGWVHQLRRQSINKLRELTAKQT